MDGTNTREDRRVRRTRRRLRDALIQLILEHGYEEITIQEITDAADLSRATFYLHYKTKDELLASSLEEMFDELVASMQSFLMRPDFDEHSEAPPSLAAFQHVAEYSDLYKSLLGDRGVSSVIYRTIDYIARLFRRQFERMLGEEQNRPTAIPVEIVAQTMAGALFALVSWWLEKDMPHSPLEMARMYHRMSLPTLRAAFGVDLKQAAMKNR